jgi:hypothetical protein
MERLTDDQLWVWNRWPDLQKAFPDVTTNETSYNNYMLWWKVYFPMEMPARMYTQPQTPEKDNILVIPGHKIRALVVTPTTDKYDQYWSEYWTALQNMDGNFDILIIDNSDNTDYFEELKKRIRPTNHITMVKHWYDQQFENVGFWQSQEKLALIHNYARNLFLGSMYSHFLSIEADVAVEKYAFRKLLRIKLPVVQAPIVRGGQYLHGTFTNYPSVGNMSMHILSKHEVDSSQLIKVDWGSIGCCLIERWVMEQVAWRSNPNGDQHDDMWFAVDCKNYNIPIHLMPGVEVRHLKM